MSRLRVWLLRAAGFIRGRGANRDLDDELQFHLDMMEEQLRRSGLPPDEARREARLRLGGVTQVRETYADQRTLPRLESWIQDTRFAVRMPVAVVSTSKRLAGSNVTCRANKQSPISMPFAGSCGATIRPTIHLER